MLIKCNVNIFGLSMSKKLVFVKLWNANKLSTADYDGTECLNLRA